MAILIWPPTLSGCAAQFSAPGELPHGEATQFLALDQGQTIGRILVSDDPLFNEHHGTSQGCFGMFECVDDPRAAQALLDAAADWLARRGRTSIVGPIDYMVDAAFTGLAANPPTNDTCDTAIAIVPVIDGAGAPVPVSGLTFGATDSIRGPCNGEEGNAEGPLAEQYESPALGSGAPDVFYSVDIPDSGDGTIGSISRCAKFHNETIAINPPAKKFDN